MLYTAIPQTEQVTVAKEKGPSYTFPSEPFDANWKYDLPFGETVIRNNGRASGDPIPANGAAEILNLLTCAAVTYIYTDNASNVLNTVLYHSHTGMIPKSEFPTVAKYNTNSVPLAQIYVVFASSQSMNLATPSAGIQTAADVLVDLLQTVNIPAANIYIITGTGARVGANSEGEIGLCPNRYWSGGNLATTLTNAANDACNDYQAQFTGGQTKIGFMGSTHNKSKSIALINTLSNAFTTAADDTALLTVLQNFMNTGHSFKDGSLKLYLTKRLNTAFRPLHTTAITSVNAKTQCTAIINGIRNGIY